MAGDALISKTVSGIRGNCMITATRITLMAVNDELARLGHAERLAKADNYFLFTGGAADGWLNRTVNLPTISSKTLEEWIAEFNRLKQVNREIIQPHARNARDSSSVRDRARQR